MTGHSAQGRTVKVGMPLLTGTESRQWLYVAMTRGTDGNWAVAFTRSAKIADPQAGTGRLRSWNVMSGCSASATASLPVRRVRIRPGATGRRRGHG